MKPNLEPTFYWKSSNVVFMKEYLNLRHPWSKDEKIRIQKPLVTIENTKYSPGLRNSWRQIFFFFYVVHEMAIVTPFSFGKK